MAKTSFDILEKMSQGKRFTRSDIEQVQEDGSMWNENLQGLSDKLEPLEDFELDTNLDGVSAYGGGAFAGLAEAAEKINGAKEKASDIRSLVEEFELHWNAFEEHAETWLDEGADRDDRAAAKEELEGVAIELDRIISDLRTEGIDPGVEL